MSKIQKLTIGTEKLSVTDETRVLVLQAQSALANHRANLTLAGKRQKTVTQAETIRIACKCLIDTLTQEDQGQLPL